MTPRSSTNRSKAPRRRLNRDERRRQLLEVAASVFAERGYHGATTAELARAAGVTEPILYQHFRNKQALFATLVEEVGDEVMTAWQTRLEGVTDPRERLRLLLASNPATHERGRSVYRVIFHAMTEAANEPTLAKALRAHVTRLGAFIESEIIALRKSRVVRDDVDSFTLSMLLVDVAIGYGLTAPLGIAGHSTTKGRAELQRVLEGIVTARA